MILSQFIALFDGLDKTKEVRFWMNHNVFSGGLVIDVVEIDGVYTIRMIDDAEEDK